MAGRKFIPVLGALGCSSNHAHVKWVFDNGCGLCKQCGRIVKTCNTCNRNWIVVKLDMEGRCTHCSRGNYWRKTQVVRDPSSRSESESPDEDDISFINDEPARKVVRAKRPAISSDEEEETTPIRRRRRLRRKRSPTLTDRDVVSESSDEDIVFQKEVLPDRDSFSDSEVVIRRKNKIISDDEVPLIDLTI